MCNSRYAFLGAIRAIAQRISYEVFLSTVLFTRFLFVGSYDIFQGRRNEFCTGIFRVGILILWLIAALAETNRAPFDFVEGESELVAGYIVEYGGGGFALLALAEYRNIMFIRIITGVIFFNRGMRLFLFGDVVFRFWVVFVSYVFVWVRGTIPRYRYDLLIDLC